MLPLLHARLPRPSVFHGGQLSLVCGISFHGNSGQKKSRSNMCIPDRDELLTCSGGGAVAESRDSQEYGGCGGCA